MRLGIEDLILVFGRPRSLAILLSVEENIKKLPKAEAERRTRKWSRVAREK